jgi:hypothetical protein
MKKKIGTILDKEVLHKFKIFCAERGRPINEEMQNAIVSYLEGNSFKKRIRINALKRLINGV